MLTTLRFAIIAVLFSANTAFAEPASDIVSEIKLGVLAHDLRIVAADPVEGGVDINAEVLFVSPKLLAPIFSPRPHLGVQVNTRGDTSQVYAGVTWTFNLTDRVWLGLAGGGTLHNGETLDQTADQKALGSQVLFRLSAELGVDVTERFNLSVYFDHESNAFLSSLNPGIDNLGMRAGFRF